MKCQNIHITEVAEEENVITINSYQQGHNLHAKSYKIINNIITKNRNTTTRLVKNL